MVYGLHVRWDSHGQALYRQTIYRAMAKVRPSVSAATNTDYPVSLEKNWPKWAKMSEISANILSKISCLLNDETPKIHLFTYYFLTLLW